MRIAPQPDDARWLSQNAALRSRTRVCSYDLANPLTPSHLLYPMYQKCVSRFFYTLSPILLHILKASDCALPRGAPPRIAAAFASAVAPGAPIQGGNARSPP